VFQVLVIILNFPFIGNVVPASVMANVSKFLMPMYNATMPMVSLFVAYLVGYYYAETEKTEQKPVFAGIATLTSFLLVSPQTLEFNKEVVPGALPTAAFGSSGLFVALIFSYLIAIVFCKAFANPKLTIKMPDSVPPMVANSFKSLTPMVITLFVACVVTFGFALTPFTNIHNFISELVQKPLMAIGTGLPAILIYQTLMQLFWFFGMHGDQIVGAVTDPILQAAGMENLEAYQAGKDLPYIITGQFSSLFVVIAFISLVLAIVITSKSKQLREVGKIASIPACFNISEPVVFGLPIVMNVVLFIPWILVRPIFTLIAYGFMATGLCPAPTGVSIPWTTPPLISGFLATNSIMGAVVQIVCLAVGTLLFIPFVRVLDRENLIAEGKIEDIKVEKTEVKEKSMPQKLVGSVE
jgi:PTS system cellobiose-specific IIC component